MSIIEGLIRKENDGSISFGNYKLEDKTKVEDFEHGGDLYKVKTFKEITRLECNGAFVYESVPGTNVDNFKFSANELNFNIQVYEDSQVTLELEPEKNYKVFINDTNVGKIKTNLGGKVVLNVEHHNDDKSHIRVQQL